MNHPQNEQELEREGRPAMAGSTQDRGVLYRRLSYVLFILAMVLFFFFVPSPGPDAGTSLFGFQNPLYGIVPDFVFVLLFSACVIGNIFLRKKARRHLEPRFVDLESPPAVLFLRPFAEDTDFRVYASWGRDRLPMSFRSRIKILKFALRTQREGVEVARCSNLVRS